MFNITSFRVIFASVNILGCWKEKVENTYEATSNLQITIHKCRINLFKMLNESVNGVFVHITVIDLAPKYIQLPCMEYLKINII